MMKQFLPQLMPRGHEWSSNGPSEVPVKLTWLKFAARVHPVSVHFIVVCRVGCQMPRVITNRAMRDLPEWNPRTMALIPGEMYGHFYK